MPCTRMIWATNNAFLVTFFSIVRSFKVILSLAKVVINPWVRGLQLLCGLKTFLRITVTAHLKKLHTIIVVVLDQFLIGLVATYQAYNYY